MSTQTGSISFEATGGFNSYAKQNYATLSQIKGQFATCGTGASIAAKVATIVPTDSGWTLYDGATITVKFTSKNTTSAPTLNVNGTGAKPIKNFNGSDLDSNTYNWPEGAAMSFTYDGSSWRLQDSNLMERVHTAETAIEQNANEISLRATKEEVNNAIDDVKITRSGEGASVVIEDSAEFPPIEITAKGWAEQDGTPTPDNPIEVRVARGRNLLNFSAPRKTGDFSAQTTRNMDGNGVWVGITANNYYNNSRIQNLTESDGVTSFTCTQAGYGIGVEAAVAPNTDYAWSAVHNENTQVAFGYYTSDGSYIGTSSVSSNGSGVITTPSDCAYVTMVLRAKSDGVICEYRQVQLELGTTPTPYVPYGHVGLEVRNATTQELVDIRAIPLPLKSDGECWAGGLPDGTADSLAIDSAGRWEWESVSDGVTIDGNAKKAWGTSTISNRVHALVEIGAGSMLNNVRDVMVFCDRLAALSGNNEYAGNSGIGVANDRFLRFNTDEIQGMTTAGEVNTWLQSHPLFTIYPLATPTTEHAYIDLPTIPEGATVDIPELAKSGIKVS